ncbi:hypothetical protein AA21952_0593 [Acetobacter oeni LMG 21952]|nr:hypothetical protein AA21952_0593 [Acetobacter oeni LMG 21952]
MVTHNSHQDKASGKLPAIDIPPPCNARKKKSKARISVASVSVFIKKNGNEENSVTTGLFKTM